MCAYVCVFVNYTCTYHFMHIVFMFMYMYYSTANVNHITEDTVSPQPCITVREASGDMKTPFWWSRRNHFQHRWTPNKHHLLFSMSIILNVAQNFYTLLEVLFLNKTVPPRKPFLASIANKHKDLLTFVKSMHGNVASPWKCYVDATGIATKVVTKGQQTRSQSVLCSEVRLYYETMKVQCQHICVSTSCFN